MYFYRYILQILELRLFSCYVLDSVIAAPVELNQEEDADSYDDASFFHAKCVYVGPFNNLRWSSRVFAVKCVCHIIVQCENGHPAHFDMTLAQEQCLHKSTGQRSQEMNEDCDYWYNLCCLLFHYNILVSLSLFSLRKL